MIAPLRTALHVYGWNLAALLSGQGHGKDSKLQPGGREDQDDEEGPAPPRHGGPQQGRSQKRPRQGCVLQSAGRGPRVGPALPAESTRRSVDPSTFADSPNCPAAASCQQVSRRSVSRI